MSATPAPQIFDRQKLAHNRSKAAISFSEYAFLKDRVSSDLIERLHDTSHIFSNGLELGAHDGRLSAALVNDPKVANMLVTDVSPDMTALAAARGLNAQIADEEHLPFDNAQFDLVLSGLSLHWVNDLPGALIQINNVLKPDGLFLGALFGAGTLSELRDCLITAETDLRGGVSPRLSPLPGLSDMAGLMQRAGFALPVVDRDTVTVRYSSPLKLIQDLKGMGEQAAFRRGMSQPLSRRVLMRAMELYAENFADPDGRVRATFEIVYLSGWAPAPHQPQPKRPGSATVSLSAAINRQRDTSD